MRRLPQYLRRVASAIVPTGLKKTIRRRLRESVPDMDSLLKLFTGRTALEIGGPTGIFGDEGFLPVYSRLERVDNSLYSTETMWSGKVTPNQQFRYHAKRKPGMQYICDATSLSSVRDSAYECVLSSHCLEHVANPLKALAEWKRCLAKDGLLLLVVPHKDGTFDWRRPTTQIEHIVADYDKSVGEDDLSHLDEILNLHDLAKDSAAGSRGDFKKRCLNNHQNRAIHHHVFDSRLALALVDRAGFNIVSVRLVKPYHIVVIAKRCEAQPENGAFMISCTNYLNGGPFRSDRQWGLESRDSLDS
jgi:SAM-dependent methyltransferase